MTLFQQQTHGCHNSRPTANYLSSRQGIVTEDEKNTKIGSNESDISKNNLIYKERVLLNHSKFGDSQFKQPYTNIHPTVGDFVTNKPKRESGQIKSFNQEFPQLGGDKTESPFGKDCGSSAWSDNAAKTKLLSTPKKVQLISRPVSNCNGTEGKNEFKSKIVLTTHRSLPLLGRQKPNGNIKENCTGHYNKLVPVIIKSNNMPASSSMEVLVKNPQKKSKSEFLKSFRDEELKSSTMENQQSSEKTFVDTYKNNNDRKSLANSESSGILITSKTTKNTNDCDDNHRISHSLDNLDAEFNDMELSSSLEAERKFLLELGWKQEDDPSYAPLTEDEVKEFQNLILARNGLLKRNTTNQSLQVNFSPKKVQSLSPFVATNSNAVTNSFDDDTSSSSDDDD